MVRGHQGYVCRGEIARINHRHISTSALRRRVRFIRTPRSTPKLTSFPCLSRNLICLTTFFHKTMITSPCSNRRLGTSLALGSGWRAAAYTRERRHVARLGSSRRRPRASSWRAASCGPKSATWRRASPPWRLFGRRGTRPSLDPEASSRSYDVASMAWRPTTAGAAAPKWSS